MYRDKIEHKYLVILMLAIIMYIDLLYFYSFLLNPKNIMITDYFHVSQWETTLSWYSVSKHTIGATAHF